MKNQIKTLTLSIAELRQLIQLTDKEAVEEALAAIDQASENPESIDSQRYTHSTTRTIADKFRKKAEQRRKRQHRTISATSSKKSATDNTDSRKTAVTISLDKKLIDTLSWLHARRDHLKSALSNLIDQISPLLPSTTSTDFINTLNLILSLSAQAHPITLLYKKSAPGLRPNSLTISLPFQ